MEWFVQRGIEVWSVKEGEQRFDSHVDKLTNYIRFWQANGESRKTAMRVKDSMNQLTEKGVYTGGVTPFGYKTVPSGRFNKRGKELLDLVIDPSEAPIVRMIYEKSIREGYGSHRLATLLNGMNIKTHNGSEPKTRRHRYICCNKARHRGVCEGQSGYVSDRIDGAVNTIVCQLVREVNISRGYELEIVLDVNYEQFLSA